MAFLHNRSRFRDQLPVPDDDPTRPQPIEPAEPADPTTDGASPPVPVRPRRLGWAQLLRRVLNVDALSCPSCATSMLVIAFITDPLVIQQILEHLNIPSNGPVIAPAQSPPQVELDFSQLTTDSDHYDISSNQPGRGPPAIMLS